MIAQLVRAARHPAVALKSATARVLGRRSSESPEFRALARDVLLTGRIEGWRFREDLFLLYQLALEIPEPGVVVEIGSYKGLATVALARGALAGGHRGVHTVDPHTGDRQDLEASGQTTVSSLEDFRSNIHWAGVDDLVTAYVMTSDKLAEQWPGTPIRFLFVDGWHSYEAVQSDLRNWAPLLTESGAVVIDDYGNYDEVRRAVDDHLDLLPPLRMCAGRMFLAHHGPLSRGLARHLSVPWGQ